MDKDTVEVIELFFKMLCVNKCKCGYESVASDCPIHGFMNYDVRDIKKKIKELKEQVQ